MLLVRAWQALLSLLPSNHAFQLPIAPADRSATLSPTFSFSEHWKAVGPFQIGTREAAWGSDPLEQYGGFRDLEYHPGTSFRSSLAVNGSVSWSNITAAVTQPDVSHASAKLNLSFPSIDWQALRDIYGWAAVQWQGWARGEIILHSSQAETLHLNTLSLLEVWVDDVHYYGGDFYQYDRAPVTLYLEPGTHRVDVRLVRDVRSMGGFGQLSVQGQLDLRKGPGMLHLQTGIMIADFVENELNAGLASPYVSAMLHNDASREIEIFKLQPGHNECVGKLLATVRLLPGQSRPVAFYIDCVGPPSGRPTFSVKSAVMYRFVGEEGVYTLDLTANVSVRGAQEPHKVTLLHPGGVVSYAILRPPSHKAEEAQPQNTSLPILLGLHGAGLEAEDELVKHALDSLPDLPAWVLFPTGGSPWSGDDWHVWGLADVEAAVAMIPEWIERNNWQGSGVSLDEWLVSGHSNGGQGAWYLLTHRPDNVFAAAVLSGYSSIQNYVPYIFWQVADPGRMAIMHAALGSYRHELLLPNTKGIPLLQQHGGLDDNVPTYNGRLMSQLIHEARSQSEYVEFPGMPHAWDGFFATRPLREFYEGELRRANKTQAKTLLNLQDFSIVTANPGDTGPKHGIHILQLAIPGQLGRIDVIFDPLTTACILWTTNIRMFRLPPYFSDCSFVMVDDQKVQGELLSQNQHLAVINTHGQWIAISGNSNEFSSTTPQRGRQLISMDAILHTAGAFQIVQHSNSSAAAHIALQISRNLCQYYAADTNITANYYEASSASGNILSIAIGDNLPHGYNTDHPIQIEEGSEIFVRAQSHSTRYTDIHGHGLAAIYLRPLPDERLELVVWGADAASLDVAARLVPMLPGTGQPDFVITDRRMLWKGIEGALALGFYDSLWNISRNSFFA